MAHGLLTVQEVNDLLDPEIYPEWDALEDNFKNHYIEQASTYVRINWTANGDLDPPFDWELAGTWPEHTDDGIAQYSNAVAVNNLYPRPVTGEPSQTPVKKTTNKVGSLTQSIEYAQSDVVRNPSQLKSIEDIFLEAGFTRINAPGSLTRV